MPRPSRLAPLGAALALLVAGQACAQGGAQDRAAQFARLDVNEDGVLSGTELRACGCAALDANRDGRVARAEFAKGAATTARTASRGTAAPPAPIAHVPWAPMGSLKVGDRVRYRAAGTLWYDGVIDRVGPDPDMPDITRTSYRVAEEGWYDHQYVAGAERAPYWTGYFLGDWEVSVPMAMNTKVIGNDLYRVVSGGMRLPPLRVNPDGTYQWRVLADGGERTIEGRWDPIPDAPGIVLRKGERDADWTLYDVTDASARNAHGRAQIYISADCCTAQTAARIPTTRVTAGDVKVGDRVFERRENGSFWLATVSEVGSGRVKLEFQYLDPKWVKLADVYRAEF